MGLTALGGSGLIGILVRLDLCTRMHKLNENFAARCVDAVNDGFPTFNLGVVDNAGLVSVALAGTVIGIRALCNQQAKATFSIGFVVIGHYVIGRAVRLSADPCHGRKCKPIGQCLIGKSGTLHYVAHMSNLFPVLIEY